MNGQNTKGSVGGCPPFVVGGWAPLVVGFLELFTQNFVLGALFGPNEVLETHLALFLDLPDVLEQFF